MTKIVFVNAVGNNLLRMLGFEWCLFKNSYVTALYSV